jgi:hypothetical protein
MVNIPSWHTKHVELAATQAVFGSVAGSATCNACMLRCQCGMMPSTVHSSAFARHDVLLVLARMTMRTV